VEDNEDEESTVPMPIDTMDEARGPPRPRRRARGTRRYPLPGRPPRFHRKDHPVSNRANGQRARTHTQVLFFSGALDAFKQRHGARADQLLGAALGAEPPPSPTVAPTRVPTVHSLPRAVRAAGPEQRTCLAAVLGSVPARAAMHAHKQQAAAAGSAAAPGAPTAASVLAGAPAPAGQ
jgi:hypothetical protein